MKVVTLTVACKNEDLRWVESDLLDLNVGVYSFGTEIRDCTTEELNELHSQLPPELID